VHSLWVNAIANAVDSSTPTAVRPAVRAASAAPIPPGTGMRLAKAEADVTGRDPNAYATYLDSRPRAAEVLVDGSNARIIRRRETYEDLVAAEL